MNYSEIKAICEIYKIVKYTINDDGTVDVNDKLVDLSYKNMTKLPLKFGKVTGDFCCSYNNLTSLEGSPISVGGSFYCSNNILTSLEGSPKYVDGYFCCYNNILTSLEGSPTSVGGRFWCWRNPLPREVIDNPKAYLKQLNRDRLLNELID
jgi:hypothetical protein